MRLTPSAHVDTFCRDHLPPLDQWPDFRFDFASYPEKLNCAVELLGSTDRDRPCLRDLSGRVWSYGEVDDTTNQLAHVLAGEGLVPGNRGLLRGPNNPWLAMSWLAVLKAGGVVVTTMALLRPREIATIAELTWPALAICDYRFTDDLAAGAPALATLIYGDDSPGGLSARCTVAPTSFCPVATSADDVAMLAPTSGTTGA